MITMAFDPDLDDCVVIALRPDDRLDREARPASRASRPIRCAASPPTCASRRWLTQQGIHVMLDKKYLGQTVARCSHQLGALLPRPEDGRQCSFEKGEGANV